MMRSDTIRRLDEIERAYILRTLRRCQGNRTRTAVVLGISIRCLRYKLGHYAQAGATVAPAKIAADGAVFEGRAGRPRSTAES